jgi:4-nitrophenyl phosphatase
MMCGFPGFYYELPAVFLPEGILPYNCAMETLIERLRSVRCFLLDMDGTFYLGDRLLPGALEFLTYLDQQAIKYQFLTNNSSKSQVEYAAKLNQLGAQVSESQIFTSGEATALYLKKTNPGCKIFLVGTPSLESEFLRFGFILSDDRPDFVVLGFDTTLTYAKIRRLCELVANGVPYIATHPDVNCPTETGYMPDIGAMIEMIAASTGRRPDVIIGKPYPPIVQAVSEMLQLQLTQICMVGDRLYTDIALGKAGILTVLVLSGETQHDEVPAAPVQPDFVRENLADLLVTLKEIHS